MALPSGLSYNRRFREGKPWGLGLLGCISPKGLNGRRKERQKGGLTRWVQRFGLRALRDGREGDE